MKNTHTIILLRVIQENDMQKIRRILILLSAVLLFGSFTPPPHCTLTVIVKGLRNNHGQIMASLNKGPEDFPDGNYYVQNYYPDFNSPTQKLVIKNLPYGDYAFSLLHDENKSGDMDSNWLGMPKEGFAFSGSYHVVFRAPKYEEANFIINSAELTIEVDMQY